MKPRTYLRTIWQTLSTPRYYLDVLNAPITFSARFFLMSYVLLTILATGLFIFIDIPRIKERSDQALTEFQQHFPENLELRWTGEELQTNATEPVPVYYPSFVNAKDLPTRFGFVLPSVVEADKLATTLPTSAWWAITPQKLFLSDRTGQWSELPLKEFEFDQPFTLTKSALPSFLPTWRMMIEYTLIALAVVYPFGWLFLALLARVFTIVFDCLVMYFFLRVLDRELPFTKLVQIALHVAVIAEIVNLIATYVFPTSTAPMFMVTFWAYMIFILSTLWNVRKIDPNQLPPRPE